MYEIIRKCNELEQNTFIETRNETNMKIYTSVGYLLTTNFDYILSLCENDFTKKFFTETQYKDIIISNEKNIRNVNLIITQPYLLFFWKQYASEYVYVVDQLPKLTSKIYGTYNTIIVSCTHMKLFFEMVCENSFKRVIFHNYENKLISNCLNYEFKWFIYSDISLIEEKITHNKELMRYILIEDEHLNKDNNIQRNYIKCKKPITVLTLDGLVDEIVLNNIEQCNIKHVIKHLTNPSIKSEKDIINHVLRNFREQLNNIETHKHCLKQMYFASVDDQLNKLRNIENKRKQILEKIVELKRRITDNNLCFICYTEIDVVCILKCCSNRVCFECINKWRKTDYSTLLCPLCKKQDFEFFVKEPVLDGGLTVDRLSSTNSIFENFECLVKQLLEKNKKIGILGKDRIFIQRFESILSNMNVKYVQLKGNYNVWRKNINALKTSYINVIFLDVSVLQAGVPISILTDLIMLPSNINPAVFNNQCKNVTINHFLTYV